MVLLWVYGERGLIDVHEVYWLGTEISIHGDEWMARVSNGCRIFLIVSDGSWTALGTVL